MGFSENKPKPDWYMANRPTSAGQYMTDQHGNPIDWDTPIHGESISVVFKFVGPDPAEPTDDPHDHGDESDA